MMGSRKSEEKSAKTINVPKKDVQKHPENNKINRVEKQISTNLSPKFTEMKSGARTSRFGRPQKETQQDFGMIPTEVAKFVSKHSPKRLKPKDRSLELNTSLNNNRDESFEALPESPDAEKENSVPECKREVSLNLEIASDTLRLAESEIELKIQDEEVKEMQVDALIPPPEEVPQINSFEDELSKAREAYGGSDEKSKQDFSDTDSALGSVASCNDIKAMKDEMFTAGQILWGSFSKTSWYPCMVYPIDDDDNIVIDNGKYKQIHVKYFNWNGCTAYLPVKNVFEFNDLDDFFEQITARNIKKNKIKSFSKSCYKAMEEANFFKKYLVHERIKIFDEVIQLQLEKTTALKRISMEAKKPDAELTRITDRKSVDSALESGGSSSPPSPPYEPIKKDDPIESFVHTMKSYDATHAIQQKRERKSVPRTSLSIPKAEEKKEETPAVDDSNRRKSNRVVKKRKFEDFEEDIKFNVSNNVPSTPQPILEPPSPAEEHKAKRAKTMKEETLEERFVLDPSVLRPILRIPSKKRACMECLTSSKEPTFRCSGNGVIKCSGWFHQACSGKFETKFEEIRHQTGDSDEIIQTQAIITVLQCKACAIGTKNCLICQQSMSVQAEGDVSQQCPNQECRMSFHKSCLKFWPQNKIVQGSTKRSNQCPQHTCHTCFSKDIHNSGQLLKCVKCPSAYHLQTTCIPAGTKVLSSTQAICPRHITEKEISRNVKEKKDKPLNVDWCNLCMDSGNLICCESCPAAFHADCINYEESDEKYICQECQEGRLPLYNTIVWARVGAYRWWPGLIMPNSAIAETTLKGQKFDREFCVRFFGSYDYAWFTCERVFNYDGTHILVNSKGGASRLNLAYELALYEAQEMAKILGSGDSQTLNSKPKPYTKLVLNRPVPPVKLRKIEEHTQEKCGCKPEDPSPCGRNSDCINMHLNFECEKATCPAGVACQNQKLRNREYADLKIVKTQHRGFGAICMKDIPEDTFIIEYVGELIDSNEFNRRMDDKIQKKEKDFYFLTIESDLYVDAEPAGNLARFINHSCEPNCVTRKVLVDGNTRIGIFSNQAIKAGTEFTFDYQMEFVGNRKTACFCESKKCSGLIGEKPLPEITEKKLRGKKKAKKRPSRIRLNLAPPEKKPRILDFDDPFASLAEEDRDPILVMLEKMPERFNQEVMEVDNDEVKNEVLTENQEDSITFDEKVEEVGVKEIGATGKSEAEPEVSAIENIHGNIEDIAAEETIEMESVVASDIAEESKVEILKDEKLSETSSQEVDVNDNTQTTEASATNETDSSATDDTKTAS